MDNTNSTAQSINANQPYSAPDTVLDIENDRETAPVKKAILKET